jgi:hypothetical protein
MIPYCSNCHHFAAASPPGRFLFWKYKGWPSRCHLDKSDRFAEAVRGTPHGASVEPTNCCWDWKKKEVG